MKEKILLIRRLSSLHEYIFGEYLKKSKGLKIRIKEQYEIYKPIRRTSRKIELFITEKSENINETIKDKEFCEYILNNSNEKIYKELHEKFSPSIFPSPNNL